MEFGYLKPITTPIIKSLGLTNNVFIYYLFFSLLSFIQKPIKDTPNSNTTLMKTKISLLLILSIVINSCTTSSSDNNTTAVIPAAPSNLSGTVVSTTQINLSWTDNASSETGFKIERKTGTGSYAIVGTVNADIVIYNDSGLTPSTSYTYRVYSYNSAGNSTTNSNEVTLTTDSVSSLPTLTTTVASTIATTTAVSGGTISSDGGATITARGICWSTTANPTIALTTKTTDGAGTGIFTSNLTALSANTTYHVRAYATNSVGTAYGNEITFVTTSASLCGNVNDIDGNTYSSVTIGTQCWMQKNLTVSKYRNGDPIPQVTDPTAFANLTTGAWCYYNNDTVNGAIYGKLYNWYAVNDPRGLAPTGYHVATDTEWLTLTTYLGGLLSSGGKMKETGTAHWLTPNTGATNSSGFTAFGPASLTYEGRWWTSTEYTSLLGWDFRLYNDSILVSRNYNYKSDGYPVRCIKD
jgi:uncharacterized protein (TIGR02145 family)